MIHPGRLTAGTCPHGGLVQIIFLSKWLISRFHVNLPGCNDDPPTGVNLWRFLGLHELLAVSSREAAHPVARKE